MKYKHIFGPVPSRRLGISLGVDLVEAKTCNFNCVYCECGASSDLKTERKEYVDSEEVLSEIKEVLKIHKNLDYITFSGSGEPCLNSKIGYIAKEIKKISNSSIALITNGSLLNDKNLMRELSDVDVLMPSLDAVSEEVFKKINRADESLKIEDIIDGLINLKTFYKGKVFLEIFMIDELNTNKAELDKFKEVILKIKADKVQLNSLDRPAPESWVETTGMEKLEEIKAYWDLDNVEIIKKYKNRKYIKAYNKDYESLILNMLDKRPCTLSDLEEISALERIELNKYLDVLEKEKKIKSIISERGIFLKKN